MLPHQVLGARPVDVAFDLQCLEEGLRRSKEEVASGGDKVQGFYRLGDL